MLFSVRSFAEVLQDWTPLKDELLSDLDFKKAAVFKHKSDKDRFIAARILCYQMLRLEYAIPLPIVFEYSEFGKPKLSGIPDFNWSHSGNYVAFFCAADAGIDIELIKECNLDSFSSVFTPTQLNWIKSDKNKFYTLWTIKEAVMKSTGLGFQLDPLELNPVFINGTNESWQLNFEGKVFFGRSLFKKCYRNNESYAISYCTSDPSIKLDSIRLH
jgi:4'-phosphopantetheinyl transferase